MRILHIIDRESVTGNTPTDMLAEQRIDVDASLDAYADACRVAVLAEYPDADYEVRFDSHCGEGTVMVGDEPDDDTEQDIREIASRVYARHGFWRYLPKPAYTLPSLTCARCGHTWTPRSASKPKQCPHCKQTGWDHPARSR